MRFTSRLCNNLKLHPRCLHCILISGLSKSENIIGSDFLFVIIIINITMEFGH